MKNYALFLFLLATTGLISSCKKDFKPENTFIKIYDDQDGNKHFHPLSICNASDGNGYIMLSAFDNWRIQLMKTDLTGAFVWNFELPENYVNAVPNLITVDGQNFLVCMDAVGLFTYVLRIDETNKTVEEIASFSSVLYPTYAYNSGQHVYIQNYNRSNYETGIHQLSTDLNSIDQSGSLSIYTDVEERIVNHVTYLGKRIPFFITSTPEQDYIVMNGFYNYSFSLVFLNPDLTFAGVYNGAGYNGGFSALSPLGNNQFALARFSFNNTYYNAKTSLLPTTIDIAESVSATGQSEIDTEKPVVIKDISINETTYQVYLAATRSNQLLLTMYEKSSGNLVGKKYIGKNIPLTVADFIQTPDMGLCILVQAKVMGSFDRIGTIKLSKSDLEAIIP